MTGWTEAVGVVLAPALLVLFALLIVIDRARPSRPNREVADEPEGTPYRVYTRDYDLELRWDELELSLPDASPDRLKGWADPGEQGWRRILATYEQQAASAPTRPLPALPTLADTAVTLLVDHSGSMKGTRIVDTVRGLTSVMDALSRSGAATELLGFSTAGWHGGLARDRWLMQGQSRRPGRLCALLHVIFKSADEQVWAVGSQEAMLRPDILRENVDGEALAWAAARLRSIPAERRILLILSDGAPVDDATLLHNGPAYLERHLLAEICAIEAAEDIMLGAVGIEHSVDRYYARSTHCGTEDVAATVLGLIASLAGNAILQG